MVNQMSKRTSISVKNDTKKELTKIGNKGESYDDIVQKLLKKFEECEEDI